MTAEEALLNALPNIQQMSAKVARKFGLDADDTAQYVAMRLLPQLREIRDADNLASLAVHRAKYVIATAIRREFEGSRGTERKNAPLDDPDRPVNIATPAAYQVDTIALRTIQATIPTLSSRERDILETVYGSDTTLAEYGDARGLRQQSVWEAHETLLTKLRAALGVAEPAKRGQGVKDENTYRFTTPEGDTVEMTRAEFIRVTGAASSNITLLLSRKRKSYKGWRLAA